MLIFQGVTDQRLEGFFLDSSTIPTWLGLRTAESLLKWSCHLKKSKMAEQISYIHVFFGVCDSILDSFVTNFPLKYITIGSGFPPKNWASFLIPGLFGWIFGIHPWNPKTTGAPNQQFFRGITQGFFGGTWDSFIG